MKGPCMCGDPYCGSCGPAQGYDPQYEEFLEAIGALTDCEELEWETVSALINGMMRIKPLSYYLGAVGRIIISQKLSCKEKLTEEDFKGLNNVLEEYPGKCLKHNEWPDSEIGCPSCYENALMETARLAAEYKEEELKYGRE
jgi:hypothetical protein